MKLSGHGRRKRKRAGSSRLLSGEEGENIRELTVDELRERAEQRKARRRIRGDQQV